MKSIAIFQFKIFRANGKTLTKCFMTFGKAAYKLKVARETDFSISSRKCSGCRLRLTFVSSKLRTGQRVLDMQQFAISFLFRVYSLPIAVKTFAHYSAHRSQENGEIENPIWLKMQCIWRQHLQMNARHNSTKRRNPHPDSACSW